MGGLALLNFKDHLVYFYTPQEALAKKSELIGTLVRVGAMVKPGSLRNQPDGKIGVLFTATDFAGSEIEVSYTHTPPDMFRENQGVVVEGRLDEQGLLIAQNLFVKHSEEYRAPDSLPSQDKALLMKSLFGTTEGMD